MPLGPPFGLTPYHENAFQNNDDFKQCLVQRAKALRPPPRPLREFSGCLILRLKLLTSH
jgi:hypothetical protein